MDTSGDGCSLTLTGAAVYDTRPDAFFGTLGVAIQGNAGAVVDLTHVAVDGASYAGIRALDRAVVQIDLAVVRDVLQAANRTELGAGVSAEEGSLTGDRVWIERASHAGAVAFQPDSVLVLRDALVRDTQIAPILPCPTCTGSECGRRTAPT